MPAKYTHEDNSAYTLQPVIRGSYGIAVPSEHPPCLILHCHLLCPLTELISLFAIQCAWNCWLGPRSLSTAVQKLLPFSFSNEDLFAPQTLLIGQRLEAWVCPSCTEIGLGAHVPGRHGAGASSVLRWHRNATLTVGKTRKLQWSNSKVEQASLSQSFMSL